MNGICGRMLLCTFITEIADSRRIGSIRRPNSLIFFFFLIILLFVFGYLESVCVCPMCYFIDALLQLMLCSSHILIWK